MRFYAPEKLDLNKLPEPLAHKVVNFFVDEIKELKDIESYRQLNDLEQFVLDEFDQLEDTYFAGAEEFDTEEYKNIQLNELTPELKNLISDEIHYFLKDADKNLQLELDPFIKSTEPTETYFCYKNNNGRVEILSANELEYDTDDLEGKYVIRGNEILTTNSRAYPDPYPVYDVYKIFDTCKEAEMFIINKIEDSLNAADESCYFESDPDEMKKDIKANLLDCYPSDEEPDEDIKNHYNNIIKEFDDDLSKLNQPQNQTQSINQGKGFKR